MLKLAGVGVDIVPGVGPVLDKPVRTAADVAALPQLTWEALEPIREALERSRAHGFQTSWQPIAAYPALSLSAEAPIAQLLSRIAGSPPLPAVSYGTEAGLYQAAGIDAIICGPGDIARAHKPDEYITRGELADCVGLLRRLCTEFARQAP